MPIAAPGIITEADLVALLKEVWNAPPMGDVIYRLEPIASPFIFLAKDGIYQTYASDFGLINRRINQWQQHYSYLNY
jgi:hypothetical protein